MRTTLYTHYECEIYALKWAGIFIVIFLFSELYQHQYSLHQTDYSGTPLMRTLWGPGEVCCIERCPHFGNKAYLGHSKVSLIIFQGCPIRGAPLYSEPAGYDHGSQC